MTQKTLNIKDKIKEQALLLGFDLCGFSKTELLISEKENLQKWLQKGFHANMNFMEKYVELRENPELLQNSTNTIISLAINYFPGKFDFTDSFEISKYALGKDYHEVLKEKLQTLLAFIKEIEPNTEGRCFVDSAPIFEKSWAQKSGLGWIGKNTLLINEEFGSHLFLGEILVNLEIEPDSSNNNSCGTCTKCIDACPTAALNPYYLDANKCIAYLTIEHKDEIATDIKEKIGNKIFGCDECQIACPWNQNLSITKSKEFQAKASLIEMNRLDWAELNEENYKRISKDSAIRRTKYHKLKQNIDFCK